MAKIKSVYVCSACGYESPKYWGKCPDCGGWNTLEEVSGSLAAKAGASLGPAAKVLTFDQIREDRQEVFPTGIEELDRVMGGGIVPSSLVLIGGEPGIGKSTLLMQCAQNCAQGGRKVLYVSAEESPAQLKMRAARLGSTDRRILIAADTRLEAILGSAMEEKPDVMIVDSVQTISGAEIASSAGSVT